MSTVNTAMPPSHARAGGGAGRGLARGRGFKRGRDWQSGRHRRDSRVLEAEKAVDEIQAKHFHIDGPMRTAALGLAKVANTGTKPTLLDEDGNEKKLIDRMSAVRSWLEGLDGALDTSIDIGGGKRVSLVQQRFSPLAEALTHVVRATSDAGYFDQLVAMLVDELTEQAKRDHDEAESRQYGDEY